MIAMPVKAPAIPKTIPGKPSAEIGGGDFFIGKTPLSPKTVREGSRIEEENPRPTGGLSQNLRARMEEPQVEDSSERRGGIPPELTVEKAEKIQELLTKNDGKLDEETAEQLVELMEEDEVLDAKNKEERLSFIDSETMISRFMLLMKLIMKLILADGVSLYSGKQLEADLPENPVEENPQVFINPSSRKQNKKSWDLFKQEVMKVEEKDGGKFLNKILAIHTKYPLEGGKKLSKFSDTKRGRRGEKPQKLSKKK